MLGAALALVANALAVVAVATLLPNQVSFRSIWLVAVFALLSGLLNACFRPFVRMLVFPLASLTLGIFSLLVNGLLFWLAARISLLGVDATVNGALITMLAAGLLSTIFGMLTTEREERRW